MMSLAEGIRVAAKQLDYAADIIICTSAILMDLEELMAYQNKLLNHRKVLATKSMTLGLTFNERKRLIKLNKLINPNPST